MFNGTDGSNIAQILKSTENRLVNLFDQAREPS